eukprot:CAMPEP_0197037114 /NCGR_PEP_ID=MMETSP1384-20130603/14409_1 /TAXON_ID=29189 /ORGANISM="Ammonia sp." /LENGTH=387 /DNA_ID=CAMNT_0042467373 /DNA_START=27 /DNA_END=1190 /DNA_ORIENTATION=-
MSDLLPKAITRHEKITQSLHSGHNIVKVAIPSYHIADDVVVYEVDVSNKKLRWNLWLRFEFFYVLHQMMQELVTELSSQDNRVVLPPFPEKRVKLFTDHFNVHFIENRRMLLENYLQKILANRYLRHSEIFISFLTPPDNEELDTKTATESSSPHDQQQYGSLNGNNANDTQPDDDQKAPDLLHNNDDAHDHDNDNDNDSNKANDDDIDSKLDEMSTQQQPNGLSKTAADNSEALIQKFMSTKNVELVGVDENDEITGCTIPQAQVLKHDHTIYQIHVENRNIKDEDHCRWTVMKRFQDFTAFDVQIRTAITNDYPNEVSLLPPLPPKYLKILVDHLDQTFIEKRRLLLQCYLQRMLKYPLLRRHDFTLKFLQVSGYDQVQIATYTE